MNVKFSNGSKNEIFTLRTPEQILQISYTTMTCTTHGQLWATDALPLDELQMAAVLGVPRKLHPAIEAAAAVRGKQTQRHIG